MDTPSLCAAPGCEKPARKNRYNACSMHEARMRRGGSFEPRHPKLTIGELLGGRSEIGSWAVVREGKPYSRRTADGSAHPDGVQRTALCRCECGTERDIPIHTLKQGHSHHCGCRNGEKNAELHGTHLMSHLPEYRVWSHMKGRCSNPNDSAWGDYGGRGITVCDRWLSGFEAFFEDMGPRPSPSHSIERQNVNGNYEPTNCVWATIDVQAINRRNNRRVEYRGERIPMMEACRRAGIPHRYKAVHQRVRKGMSFAEAMAKEGKAA